MPAPRPLACQEALQRRLGLDDEAFNYLMANACVLADKLRETGAPPFGTWIMALQALALLGAGTLSPSSSSQQLADGLRDVIRENFPDQLAMAIDFARHHLPADGGGGENAYESAWDDRVHPENQGPLPHGVMQ